MMFQKLIDIRPQCQRCYSKLVKNYTMDWWECPSCKSIEHDSSEVHAQHSDTDCPNTLFMCVSDTPVKVKRMRPRPNWRY